LTAKHLALAHLIQGDGVPLKCQHKADDPYSK
jgi:hypothetical protein